MKIKRTIIKISDPDRKPDDQIRHLFCSLLYDCRCWWLVTIDLVDLMFDRYEGDTSYKLPAISRFVFIMFYNFVIENRVFNASIFCRYFTNLC